MNEHIEQSSVLRMACEVRRISQEHKPCRFKLGTILKQFASLLPYNRGVQEGSAENSPCHRKFYTIRLTII